MFFWNYFWKREASFIWNYFWKREASFKFCIASAGQSYITKQEHFYHALVRSVYNVQLLVLYNDCPLVFYD